MGRRTPSPRLLLPLALLLAVTVVGVGGVSFWRNVESFQPLGFEAVPTGGQWQVVRAERGVTLQPGDQILLVNGREAGALADLAGALRKRPASELVVLRAGALETLSYERPPLAVDYPYVVLVLIGAVYLLIGLYTLLRDTTRSATLFFLWCLISGLVYLASASPPFDAVGKGIYLLEELGRILLAPLTLHLFYVFPRRRKASELSGKVAAFFYLPAAFLLLLQVDLIAFNGRWLLSGKLASSLQLLDKLELFHLVAFALAAAALLGWRLRRSAQPETSRQIGWIAVGMAAGYVPFLAFYLLPLTLGLNWTRPVTALAVLPLALVPLTFAWAILRYKLWDIAVLVRETTAMSLTVLIGVVGFSLVNSVINRTLPGELDLARNLLAFVSGLMIAGLMLPARRGIGNSLERLHYRDSYGKRRALAEFGRELLDERDLGRLSTGLLQRLSEALDLPLANLFLAHEEMLVPIRPTALIPNLVKLEEPGDDFWERDVRTISGVELPSHEAGLERRLFEAGYRYAFPLAIRSKRIGMLVTGYRSGQVPLSSEDIELIRGLLNQATLAIDNAELLDQVHHQLEEVTRLQRFNQGIIESSPAGIAVVGTGGRVLAANRAFEGLAGVKIGAATGRDLTDLLPLDSVPRPSSGLKEVSFTDPEGRERFLQISAAQLQEEGEEEQQVIVVQDISERVEMENTLREKERLAALGMLAAGVAHEVNTPITGISSYAQMLLAETPESDPKHAILRKMERQTFRAARIVNNLLEFARERSRERRPVDLEMLLRECLDLYGERILEAGVTLSWRLPEGEQIVVHGDEGELQQVFTNLAANAVEALEMSGGDLEVAVDADERWVRISFTDDGPGISPSDLDKIFQPFYSTKLAKGGTGLGLSISFNIVRHHGGDLRVFSRPGEGSRFTVELPRRDRPTDEHSDR